MIDRGLSSAWCACALGLLTLLAACGSGDDDSRTAPASTAATASAQCDQAFRQGHDAEAAGVATTDAFLPSIEGCDSLDEWTAAAKAFGVDLRGQEATFVDGVCSTADERTRSSRICQQAQEKFRNP